VKNVRTTHLALLVGVVALGLACQRETLRTSGLDGIRESGELRVLVRPGFDTSTIPGDGRVDEAELIWQLAARLQADVRWIEPPRHDQLIPWLLEGRGDLAVSRFSPADLVATGASPTSAIDWVEELLVTGRTAREGQATGPSDAVVLVPQPFQSPALDTILGQRGLQVEHVAEGEAIEAVLERVREGLSPYAIVDSGLVAATGGLEIVDSLHGPRPLVWALRQYNGGLRRSVDDFLFAEKVLGRTAPISSCRDLADIRRARVLRLITRNSPTTYTVERGGLEGYEYRLAYEFAREIGVRLELEIPPPGLDPMWWLERGFGDLVALHEPMAPADIGRFTASTSYREVDLVAVQPARRAPFAGVDDLAGMLVAASRSVAQLCGQLPLDPEIEVGSGDASRDGLGAIREVSVGRVDAAVVDEDTARLALLDRPDLQIGTVVLPDVELVWILNPSSPKLRAQVDRFLGAARRSGMARQLAYSHLGSWTAPVPADWPDVPDGAITPYDEVLRWTGRTEGIDWRLLASLMYEESRFDPEAVGPGGSAGLFQFMPKTWGDLDYEDPHHPGEAVEAGGWYLRWLMDKFSHLDLPDQVAMAIASYNVGPRHVFDARRLAADMGFDPDRWSGNVETAMLILNDPEVARRYPAGVCRCRRAVGYTRRILRRYRAYTEQFPPDG